MKMMKMITAASSKINFVLILLSLLAVLLSCFIGSTDLSFADIISALFGSENTSAEIITEIIVWELRLPRALAAWVTGFALGISGAALQAMLRNPLAEPGVLGISSVSVLFSTFVIFYGFAGVGGFGLPLASISGALVATFLISLAARRAINMVALILVGVGLSSFAGAMMALLMNLAPNPFTLSDMINWTLGSVAYRSFDDIALVLPFMAFGTFCLMRQSGALSALTLGEEAARGVGVNLKQMRLMVVLGTGVLTGASVALAGAIGFVGIVAPHIIRPFMAYNSGKTLVPSGLLAGLILVLADIIIRLIPSPAELKLGVVAALIGAPVFVWIAVHGIRQTYAREAGEQA